MNGSSPRLSVAQILNPRSIAVIGASEDLRKFGSRVLNNTINGGFSGRIVAVNPKRTQIFGVPAHARVGELKERVDVAVIAVPLPLVQNIVEECAALRVGCCVVITAGYSEIDREGAQLQQALAETARAVGMRIIGPNCLGYINTHANLLLNSSPSMEVTPLRAGGIGHVTQSGALMATVYNRGVDDGAYFSACISVGNQADLELADFVEYMADDPNTRVVTLYVEGFKDPQRFVRAVRRCRAAGKPVLMVKAGRSTHGARVTRSHTASLASSHEVLRAVCREEGIVLVDDTCGMIQAAEFLSRFGPPEGDGICVVSGSGGAAAIAADRLSDRGLRLARFAATTRARLEDIYEPTQLGNPLDIGALREKSYTKVDDAGLGVAAGDRDVSAILALITTAPMIGKVTRCLAEAALASTKPVLFVVIQGSADDGARAALKELNVLAYETLDEALRVLDCAMHARALRAETKAALRPNDLPANDALAGLAAGQLTEYETKALVARYGLPVARGTLAANVEDALLAAEDIGYPIALKVSSRDVLHKSDVGGVHLDIDCADALKRAWGKIGDSVPGPLEGCLVCEMVKGEVELIAGIKRDDEFGPVVLFGLGGLTAEIVSDVQIVPAPVSAESVLSRLEELQLWPLLAGARGRPVLDARAAAQTISRLSWLAVDAQRLTELDLNPVIVRESGKGVVVVDARATLDDGIGT